MMNRFLQRDQVAGRIQRALGSLLAANLQKYSHCPADAIASARYHLKLISEGNFITKNIAVRYQLYVIGGSQADD
jgi:hypothetical protein